METDDKYKTKITVRDEKVLMVGSIKASYSETDDEIRIKKGEVSAEDFGMNSDDRPKELDIIHERQHQINAHKGIGTATMSLEENYQRQTHNEITALIAEKLEIRRQYQAAKTPAQKEAFFKKFGNIPDHKEYIDAIKSGKVNPNSTSSKEFLKEMELIKESSIRYRADPNDDGYRKTFEKNSLAYLSTHGSNCKSNPAALKKEVEAMYNIGGFDFNTVGSNKINVLENQSMATADKLLAEGAAPQKVIHYMQTANGLKTKKADSLDISGLSREQAEKVIQTAIMTEELADYVAQDMAMGDKPNYRYKYIAGNIKNQTAAYLDVKADIWEKNNTLSEQGDEEKFNRLMEEAKKITLEPQNLEGWIKHHIPPFTEEQIKEIEKRQKELNGKQVNFDEIVPDADELVLPLDGTSREAVLEEMARKEAEDAAFWEEYNKTHPEEKPEFSDPYQVEVTDLESSMLKDELDKRKEEESKVEQLFTSPTPRNFIPEETPLQPEKNTYSEITLEHMTGKDGTTKEVSIIDGKKHGAEITRDKNGNVTDIKLYDHGKEIDMEGHTVEFKSDTKDGMDYEYLLLDGEMFGTQKVTDSNGKTKAAFYDQGGWMINAESNATVTKTEKELPAERETLKNEIAAQHGEPIEATPSDKAKQMRFSMRVDEHDENAKTNDITQTQETEKTTERRSISNGGFIQQQISR